MCVYIDVYTSVCVCVYVDMLVYMYYVSRSVGNSYGDVSDNAKDLAPLASSPCFFLAGCGAD